jgi:hypothetical protein
MRMSFKRRVDACSGKRNTSTHYGHDTILKKVHLERTRFQQGSILATPEARGPKTRSGPSPEQFHRALRQMPQVRELQVVGVSGAWRPTDSPVGQFLSYTASHRGVHWITYSGASRPF